MSRNVVAIVVLSSGLVGLAGGCFAPDPPSINSRNPDQLIPAIKAGVQAKDGRIIPDLVRNLESDDPAVRFYAIDGLRRMTNQDFGYRFYDDDDARKPAVDRWKRWLAEKR